MKELFKQLRGEAPTRYVDVLESYPSQYPTRWNVKGLLTSKHNRTVVKIKSLENTLQKAYNWLKYIDLLLKNL